MEHQKKHPCRDTRCLPWSWLNMELKDKSAASCPHNTNTAPIALYAQCVLAGITKQAFTLQVYLR